MSDIVYEPKYCTYDDFIKRCVAKNKECIQYSSAYITFFNKLMMQCKENDLDNLYNQYYTIICQMINELEDQIKSDNEFGSDQHKFTVCMRTEAERIEKVLHDSSILPERTVDIRIFEQIPDNNGYMALIYIPIMLLDYYSMTNGILMRMEMNRPSACEVPSKDITDTIRQTSSEVKGLLTHIFEKLVY